MYIKTFHHPSYQQTQQPQQQSNQQIKNVSPESGYSTSSNNMNKKLVYEVIV